MKRYIFSFVFCFLCMAISAQEYDYTLKFFRGIGNNMTDTSTDVANTTAVYSNLIPMQKQLETVNNKLKYPQYPLKIVGHSQGGLRALAYAGYLNQRGRANEIESIISIGGPVCGFGPLSQGAGVLKTRLDAAANFVSGGYQAVINLDSWVNGKDTIINYGGGVEGLCKSFGIKDIDLTDLVNSASNTATSYPDMVPGSEFIRNNIFSFYISFIPILVDSPTGPYLVFCLPIINANWKLPAGKKYGFIVGTNSNVLSLADAEFQGIPTGYGLYMRPSDIANLYVSVTSLACTAWNTKRIIDQAELDALASNPITRNMYPGHIADLQQAINKDIEYAGLALNGSNYVSAIESNISTILGTAVNENDGFIPSGDQYIDVSAFNGTYIDELTKGKFSGYYNHITETTNPEIWGMGGSLSNNSIGYNGKLARWLYGNSFTSGTKTGENVD